MKTASVMLLAVAAACLTGCASRPANPAAGLDLRAVAGRVEEVKLPAAGVTVTAAVGSSMVSSAKVLVSEVVELPNGLRVSQPYAHDPTVWTYEFNIPPGTYKATARDRFGSTFFPFGRQLVSWISGGKVSHSEQAAADLKFTQDGAPVFEWAIPGSGELTRLPLSARFARSTKQEAAPDGFKRELIYTGRAGNAVSILYREFVNDMARPAFSQQLQYDVSTDAVIGYKGARFEVLKADNTGITYRVLAPMD
jgi:hypothetical protein